MEALASGPAVRDTFFLPQVITKKHPPEGCPGPPAFLHYLLSSRPYFPVLVHAMKNKTFLRVCGGGQGNAGPGGILRSSPAGPPGWASGTSHLEMYALREVSSLVPAGFRLPVVAEGEVWQRVQNSLAGAAADPRDRRRKRAQDPHGRAPPREH